MKVIQYTLPADYDKEQVKTTAGLLFKKLMQIIKKINDYADAYETEDFAIYPINGLKIAKNRKILMVGNNAGVPLVEALDELYLRDLEKNNLRVYREEFIK